jgi:hypothetical protein
VAKSSKNAVKWSEKWSVVKGIKLWWGSDGYIGLLKRYEWKIILKLVCNSSRQYVFKYCYCLVYSGLKFVLIVIFVNIIFIILIVWGVPLIVVVSSTLFCLRVVCSLVWHVLLVCRVLMQYSCHRRKKHLQLK